MVEVTILCGFSCEFWRGRGLVPIREWRLVYVGFVFLVILEVDPETHL